MSGDGIADLWVNSYNKSTFIRGLSSGRFESPSDYTFGDYWSEKLVEDINGDGNLDLITRGRQSVNVLLGKGDGSFEPPSLLPTSRSLTDARDANNDGLIDILLVGPDDIEILANLGGGTFTSLAVSPLSVKEALQIEDFDRDGYVGRHLRSLPLIFFARQ